MSKFLISLFFLLLNYNVFSYEKVSQIQCNKTLINTILTSENESLFICFSKNENLIRLIDGSGNILKNYTPGYHSLVLNFLFLNSDSTMLYCSQKNKSIYINKLDWTTGKETTFQLGNIQNLSSLSYSKIMNRYFGTLPTNQVICWDGETGKQIFSLDSSEGYWAKTVYSSKYSNMIALIQNDKFIIYDAELGKAINVIPASTSQRTTAYFHKKDSLISVSSGLGYLQTFNYYTGELLYYYYCSADNPIFFHNDSLLLSANQIIEVKTGKVTNDFSDICAYPLCTNILESKSKTYAIFGLTNLFIHCLETDSTIKVFEFEGIENSNFLSNRSIVGWGANRLFISDFEKLNLQTSKMKIYTVKQYLRNERLFAGLNYNKDTIILYNPEVNDYIEQYPVFIKSSDVRFSENLHYCSNLDYNGKLTLRNWNTKQVISEDSSGAIFSYYFSPDSYYGFSYFFDFNGDQKIKIIQTSTGKLIKEIPFTYSQGANFTPDGQYLVVSKGIDKKFVFYKAPAFDSTGYIDIKSNWSEYPIVFSKDGKYMLPETKDGFVEFFNLDSSVVSFSVGGYFNGIDTYAFSDDETKILINYADGTIILYDINGVLDVPQSSNPLENATIFPNPAVNFIELPFAGDFLLQNSYRAFSANGEEFELRAITCSEGRLKLSVSDLPPGNYFLSLKDGKSSQTFKFIIVR